ncbi:prophage pi1 protein 32 [Furfurilactobacillus sp. OKN36]
MPVMRVCKAAGCHRSVSADQENPYCSEHAQYYRKQPVHKSAQGKRRYSQYNKYRRDKEANAFYHDKHWSHLSVRLKREAYFTCECCGHTYDKSGYLVVDHITPRRVDKRKQLDTDNLWVICKRCHYWKGELEKEIYKPKATFENLDASKKWDKDKCQKWILQKESHSKSGRSDEKGARPLN